MTLSKYDFDLFVVGCGPAGFHASLEATRLGKRVGVAEVARFRRGEFIDMGSVTSKTIRESILRRSFLGGSFWNVALNNLSIDDFIAGIRHVSEYEQESHLRQIQAHGVILFEGYAKFIDPHTLAVVDKQGGTHRVSAEKIILGVGSQAFRDPKLPIDGIHVFTHEDILNLGQIPASMAIWGGGLIGLEYACIFQLLGVSIVLIDQREQLLPSIDQELVSTLLYAVRKQGMRVILKTELDRVIVENGTGGRVNLRLKSGEQIHIDKLMVNQGRVGSTGQLELWRAGIVADEDGFIPVNSDYQTAINHIYAVGDVTGYPRLASESMEQGRKAVRHAFQADRQQYENWTPTGIYTIPEISTVGWTEEQLIDKKIPYVAGYARYRDLAKGLMIGDDVGFLKILFDPVNKNILGIHILGEGASEIIHIGKAVMELGGTLEYFMRSAINYPSLAESYRLAAYDGYSKIRKRAS